MEKHPFDEDYEDESIWFSLIFIFTCIFVIIYNACS
jgi:hypothetical protein